MRTREQNTQRYFASIWSVYVLSTGAIIVGFFITDSSVADWFIAVVLTVWSAVAAVIGFLHGITIFVARERDAEDAARAIAPLCLDDYCADVECPNRHE